MVSLLDVLSLPSCGWSSREAIIKEEVLRGFNRITSGKGVLVDQETFNTIIQTFIEKEIAWQNILSYVCHHTSN